MNAYSGPVRPAVPGISPKWLYGFMICQFICIGALVVEELGVFRFAFRFFAFASSLMMLAALLTAPNPSARGFVLRALASAYIVILSLGFLHPALNGPLVGIAQIGLNVAIMAPLFWVPRVAIDSAVLRRLILLIWGFNTLSSLVGVLQVYYPERFMPDPQFIRQLAGEDIAESLKIQLDDGTSLFRPMGLSDGPGGAGPAGLAAFVTGLALAVTDKVMAIRILGFLGASLGIFCVYISQVRVSLIVAGIDLMVFMAMMALRGKLDRAAGLLLVSGLSISAGFIWVMSVGSAAVGTRLATLTEKNAVELYQSNRGNFLLVTFEEFVPSYPFGAGLGRYGMMHSYFGDKANPSSPSLYAEIQWTSWVFDGGLPLMFIGFSALVVALYFSVRVALTSRDPVLADMATIITTLNLGTITQTFGSIPFAGQSGLSFWVLNATLFMATVARRPRPRPAAPRVAW